MLFRLLFQEIGERLDLTVEVEILALHQILRVSVEDGIEIIAIIGFFISTFNPANNRI